MKQINLYSIALIIWLITAYSMFTLVSVLNVSFVFYGIAWILLLALSGILVGIIHRKEVK